MMEKKLILNSKSFGISGTRVVNLRLDKLGRGFRWTGPGRTVRPKIYNSDRHFIPQDKATVDEIVKNFEIIVFRSIVIESSIKKP